MEPQQTSSFWPVAAFLASAIILPLLGVIWALLRKQLDGIEAKLDAKVSQEVCGERHGSVARVADVRAVEVRCDSIERRLDSDEEQIVRIAERNTPATTRG